MEHQHTDNQVAGPVEPSVAAANGAARPTEALTMPMAIVIAAALVSASVVYFAWAGMQGGKSAPAEVPGGDEGPAVVAGLPPVGDRDVILGDANAPVTVIEYADYQCPFCGRFHTQAAASIKNEYVKSGKVRLVYRNFAFLGPESKEAAAAAECAKDQGKFWLFHDALYAAEIADGEEHNGNLNRALFLKLAKDVGMDQGAFTACYDSKKYAALVDQQVAEASAIGVNSTPTTYVNGKQIVGAQPFGTFKTAIDAELAN